VDRGAIVADLTACRKDLHQLLATATPDRLQARSNGTRWTNEQLPFHMALLPPQCVNHPSYGPHCAMGRAISAAMRTVQPDRVDNANG
jgi:hypothetical protein